MSKLDELINQYCPMGVEYKELGKYAKIETGTQLNKTNLTETGVYPVYNGGIYQSGYYHEYNAKENTIAISQGGASAGFVNFVKSKFWAGAHCYTIIVDENILNNKYVYYILKNSQNKLMDSKVGAGIPGLNRKEIQNLLLPIPPLQVQEEIVKILDNFTNLTAELEAELESRKKQYEYYRDELLELGDRVEYKNICEIFDIKGGYTPSKANSLYWEDGNIPWFRMEDIRNNGSILTKSKQYINKLGLRRLFKNNSIILATTATIGEHALVKVEFVANQQFSIFELKDIYLDTINMDFMNYYFYKIDEWCKNNINVSGFASVDMKGLKKIQIPIPSREEQERIVAILDKLYKLVNDMTKEGLPAEIEKRKQQYEYYRNKLLTFDEVNKNV